MVIIALVLGIGILVLAKVGNKSSRSRGKKRGAVKDGASPVLPKFTVSVEFVQPDFEEMARQREAAKKAKLEAIEDLKTSYNRPATVAVGINNLQNAVTSFAKAHGTNSPDFEGLDKNCETEAPKKTELQIRKLMNAAYKRREDAAQLVEALALCVVHVQFMLKNPNSQWKVGASIKRLLSNLRHENYRSDCIGFLYVFSDALRAVDSDLVKLCEEQINALFTASYNDDQYKVNFHENMARLPLSKSTSDKHFILNALVEYLERRRRFDPSLREELIRLCEIDIAIYKEFLVDFGAVGLKKKTFAQVRRSKEYFCPYLPSFNALWDLYIEEDNKVELKRLLNINNEIGYGYADEEMVGLEEGTASLKMSREKSENIADPCEVEIIEVSKSGQKGKLAFFDSKGNLCSTEEVAKDHFEGLGFRVLRGEVQFWQAMFALAFWEEIFEGTGTPNGFNDIPSDLFSGDQFYLSRREKINQKFAAIQSGNIHRFMTHQIEKYSKHWTRIIYGGGSGNFDYLTTLQSTEVSDFFKAVDPAIFAKIIYRIALNPTENRAGTPDYIIWKGTDVSFVEVKGVREKIRDAQSLWLGWMKSENMQVKILRVRGRPISSEPAA